MKKYFPFIILLVGIFVSIVVYVFVMGKKDKPEDISSDEAVLLELSLEKRPFVTLTPTSDGHFLNMKIKKIDFGAFSLDYELIYQVPGGVQQGVPGSVNLSGKREFETELLLGSESAGKFRYDEGVEEGVLTLRFRDEEGRLLARFSTEFHMQTSTDLLISLDSKFKYELEEDSEEYFVTMITIGHPEFTFGEINTDIYGILTSDESVKPGNVTIESSNNIYRWADDRFTLESYNSGKMPDIGIFAGLKNIPED